MCVIVRVSDFRRIDVVNGMAADGNNEVLMKLDWGFAASVVWRDGSCAPCALLWLK